MDLMSGNNDVYVIWMDLIKLKFAFLLLCCHWGRAWKLELPSEVLRGKNIQGKDPCENVVKVSFGLCVLLLMCTPACTHY